MVLNSLRLRLDKKYFLFENLRVFFKHETACFTLIRTEGTRATDKMKKLLPEISGPQSPWSSVHSRVINIQVGNKKVKLSEIKLSTSVGSSKKQENSRKTSASLTTLKTLTVWITTNFGKFLKRWEYQTTWPASWEICMHVKKQQLELDMEQQSGSKLGKKYVKTVSCHLAYLTYMQSTSFEMPGWMKHKLESRLQGEISITSDMQMTPP